MDAATMTPPADALPLTTDEIVLLAFELESVAWDVQGAIEAAVEGLVA